MYDRWLLHEVVLQVHCIAETKSPAVFAEQLNVMYPPPEACLGDGDQFVKLLRNES